MAYRVGDMITRQDIMNQFIQRLRNVVLSKDFVTADSPNAYVPYSVLGRISEITYLSYNAIGNNMSTVIGPGQTAGSLYGGLTYITKLLLKVGTWSYKKEDTGRYSYVYGGSCIFNDATVLNCFRVGYLVHLPISPPTTGLNKFDPITFNAIESLIQNLINAYNNAPKIQLEIEDTRCHVDCHTNVTEPWQCHQDYWHSGSGDDYPGGVGQPDCYRNGPWVYGAAAGSHWNSSPQSNTHRDSGTNTNECHTNHSRLSLTNSYGGCNTIDI